MLVPRVMSGVTFTGGMEYRGDGEVDVGLSGCRVSVALVPEGKSSIDTQNVVGDGCRPEESIEQSALAFFAIQGILSGSDNGQISCVARIMFLHLFEESAFFVPRREAERGVGWKKQ